MSSSISCPSVGGGQCLTPKGCTAARECLHSPRLLDMDRENSRRAFLNLPPVSNLPVTATEIRVSQQPPTVDGQGLRYNAGKRDFTLIPPDALAYLADLFTVGAKKYAPRNWERGMAYSNVMTSLDRHWNAFKSGEDYDPESKLYHMVHVCWNAMALLTYQIRGIGTDDRFKNPLPPTPDYDAMNAGGTGASNGGDRG